MATWRLHDYREDGSSGEVSEEETTWPAACFGVVLDLMTPYAYLSTTKDFQYFILDQLQKVLKTLL